MMGRRQVVRGALYDAASIEDHVPRDHIHRRHRRTRDGNTRRLSRLRHPKSGIARWPAATASGSRLR